MIAVVEELTGGKHRRGKGSEDNATEFGQQTQLQYDAFDLFDYGDMSPLSPSPSSPCQAPALEVATDLRFSVCVHPCFFN